jgi:hypothetical protein
MGFSRPPVGENPRNCGCDEGLVRLRLLAPAPLRQTSGMSFTRRGLRVLLALLLVFSQQQAVLHLLGHDLAQFEAQKRGDTSDPQELVCAKCLAIAHLDHAVDVGIVTLDLPAPVTVAVDVPVEAGTTPAFVARYRSRAPPLLS